MLNKVYNICKRYNEISERLSLPEVYSNAQLYASYEKELRELRPVAEKYTAYSEAGEEKKAVEAMLSDPELHEAAEEELPKIEARIEALLSELRQELIPKDPDDDKNAIMEIRGGVGGEEGMLFAADLYRMYSMFADKNDWKINITNIIETDLGGIKEVCFVVEGKGAYSKLKYEGGGHRVQRVPETESGGRIHTSAATVAVFPETEEVDFKLDMNDVKIDTFRSSGAGGQHVNKTESAIRVTHLTTGLVVECQDERSQYKNKDRAMQILRSKLYNEEKRKNREAISQDRKNQVGSGDRSERIRTYNFPQNRVTDHRLEGENRSFNLNRIINGELEDLIHELIICERASNLNNITVVTNED